MGQERGIHFINKEQTFSLPPTSIVTIKGGLYRDDRGVWD